MKMTYNEIRTLLLKGAQVTEHSPMATYYYFLKCDKLPEPELYFTFDDNVEPLKIHLPYMNNVVSDVTVNWTEAFNKSVQDTLDETD